MPTDLDHCRARDTAPAIEAGIPSHTANLIDLKVSPG
jgi:hypothetical protein